MASLFFVKYCMIKQITVGGCRIPVTNNIADNLVEIKNAINWAFDNSVDIICTPECSLSGYMWKPNNKEDPRVLELDIAIEEVKRYSAEKKVDIVLGTAWYNNKNQWANAQAFIIDGEHQFTHEKNLLFPLEQEIYYPGNSSEVFDYKGVRIAGLICNDAWANTMYWPGQSGILLKSLAEKNVHFVFLSSFVPKEPGPNNMFYRWCQSQVELAGAFGNWHTIVCDTTTNIDGSAYNGPPASPIGICDSCAEWTRDSDTGITYFKASFRPEHN